MFETPWFRWTAGTAMGPMKSKETWNIQPSETDLPNSPPFPGYGGGQGEHQVKPEEVGNLPPFQKRRNIPWKMDGWKLEDEFISVRVVPLKRGHVNYVNSGGGGKLCLADDCFSYTGSLYYAMGMKVVAMRSLKSWWYLAKLIQAFKHGACKSAVITFHLRCALFRC